MSDLVTQTQWKCSGASVIGNSHEKNETLCQDAWAWDHYNGVSAVCVCDGAGSALHSGIGAQKTAEIVVNWLSACFEQVMQSPRSAFENVLEAILQELEEQTKAIPCELRELACTLVAVAADESGRWLSWHLGDGGVIARFGEEVRVLSTPQKGEYANETYFVTEEAAAENLQCAVSTEETQNVTGFAVFSDGLERLLYSHATLEVAPAVPAMWNWHLQADEKMVSQSIETNIAETFRQMTNDDCSLVLLTRSMSDENI